MNCSPLVLAMMISINFPPTCSPGSLAERHRAPPPGLRNSSRASLISDIPCVWRLNTLMRIKSLRFHHLSPFSPHNSGFCVCSFTPPRCVLMGGWFYFVIFLAGSYLALTLVLSVHVLFCQVSVSVDISGQFTLKKGWTRLKVWRCRNCSFK